VLKVDYVVLTSSGSKEVAANNEGISGLVQELVADYIL
jgi:hypothetical protein